jgi:hypothetical protein
VNVNSQVSASEPDTVTDFATSSFVESEPADATGAVFEAVTVMFTVAVGESAVPSFTLNWNESGPV